MKQAGAENPWQKEMELTQAAKAGDRSRVQELLQQGADVNHIQRGGTALQVSLYEFALAKGTPNEELVKDLLKAGADVSLGSDSGCMYPPLLQVISTQKPDLVRMFLAELEEFTGLKSQPLDQDKGRGVVTVVVDAEAETKALRDADPDLYEYTAEWIAYRKKVDEIFEALQRRFLERGCYLCRIGAHAVVDRGRFVGLFPTDNPFEIMAFVNVRGNEVELSTDQVVSWFQKFFRDHPFRLTACLGDTVDITLLNPVSDPMKLARALQRFCPDMVSQGIETLGALAEQLRNSPKVHFWWD